MRRATLWLLGVPFVLPRRSAVTGCCLLKQAVPQIRRGMPSNSVPSPSPPPGV